MRVILMESQDSRLSNDILKVLQDHVKWNCHQIKKRKNIFKNILRDVLCSDQLFLHKSEKSRLPSCGFLSPLHFRKTPGSAAFLVFEKKVQNENNSQTQKIAVISGSPLIRALINVSPRAVNPIFSANKASTDHLDQRSNIGI